MRKTFLHYVFGLMMVSLFAGCDKSSKPQDKPAEGTPPEAQQENNTDSLVKPDLEADTVHIKAQSRQIVQLLKDKDFKKLSSFVHPVKGLRFSPYAFVNPNQDIQLSASQVQGLTASDSIYHWGSYDGTGKPIQKTFNGYYKEFICDADFLHADLYLNKDMQRGNAINNARRIYGDKANIIEFYIPGMETKYGGLDWRSLSLVFTPYQGKYYLAGIIHSQWTI